MNRPATVRIIAMALSTLTLAACGGGDGETAATETPTPEMAFTPSETATVDETMAVATETTPEPTPTATDGTVYTVEEGDSLSGIAQRFNTTVDALIDANDLEDPDTIFPGDEITIPESTPEPDATE